MVATRDLFGRGTSVARSVTYGTYLWVVPSLPVPEKKRKKRKRNVRAMAATANGSEEPDLGSGLHPTGRRQLDLQETGPFRKRKLEEGEKARTPNIVSRFFFLSWMDYLQPPPRQELRCNTPSPSHPI